VFGWLSKTGASAAGRRVSVLPVGGVVGLAGAVGVLVGVAVLVGVGVGPVVGVLVGVAVLVAVGVFVGTGVLVGVGVIVAVGVGPVAKVRINSGDGFFSRELKRTPSEPSGRNTKL